MLRIHLGGSYLQSKSKSTSKLLRNKQNSGPKLKRIAFGRVFCDFLHQYCSKLSFEKGYMTACYGRIHTKIFKNVYYFHIWKGCGQIRSYPPCMHGLYTWTLPLDHLTSPPKSYWPLSTKFPLLTSWIGAFSSTLGGIFQHLVGFITRGCISDGYLQR